MAISPKNEHRAALARQAVDSSLLNADAKADLDELLASSLASTNGLGEQEKLDAVADTLFNLTRLICVHIAERPHPTSWRDVIIACRHEFLILGLAVVVLLMLRPQIALALERLLPVVH